MATTTKNPPTSPTKTIADGYRSSNAGRAQAAGVATEAVRAALEVITDPDEVEKLRADVLALFPVEDDEQDDGA